VCTTTQVVWPRMVKTFMKFIVVAAIALLGKANAADANGNPADGAFQNWRMAHKTSAGDLATGIQLAKQRALEMRALMEKDPQSFVRRALPEAERANLPAEVQAHVERRVQKRGFFGVHCVLPTAEEPSGHAPAGFRREVVLDGVRYEAFVYGQWVEQETVRDALIDGVVLGNGIALGDSATPAEQMAAGQAVIALAPSTAGTNTLLYYIARFSDETAYTNEPISEATASNQMAVVSQFWLNNSSGAVALRGLADPSNGMDIVHVELPKPHGSYTNNFSQLLTDARNAAASNGFAYSNYNLDLVVTTNWGFSYAGIAWVGGQGAHVVRGYTSLRTSGHELGHNLGLWHANYWRTDATRPFSRDSIPGGQVGDTSNAEWIEYGHYFSVMSAQGGGEMDDATKPHYAAVEKVKLGWLTGSEVQYVSTSGTYRLYRHDHRSTTNNPRAIRIETGATDYTGNARRYWLNYRYAPWNIATNWFRNGLQIDVAKTTYGSDGAIQLDMTPYSSNEVSGASWTSDNTDKKDGALVVGRTYSDTAAGIHITPSATGSSGTNEEYIDCIINLGPFPGNRAPAIINLTASATQTGTSQNVNFTVDAADPDGDSLVYAWDFGQAQTWTTSGLNSNAATKSWPTVGQYRVVVTVSDRKGGVASQSQVITIGAPANNRQISGRVLQSGKPIYNARVYSGVLQAWTDTDGSYVLLGLSAVTPYTLASQRDDLGFTAQFANPVSLTTGDAYGRDFHATNLLAGAALTVTPYTVITSNGQSVAFSAAKWDATGTLVAALPAWSATGGGTIDATGLYSATSPGTFNVLASDSGLLATATVTVVGGVALPPYDAWRHAKFTAAELLNPLISGDTVDPDRDGLANLLEYACGFEPKNAASGVMPSGDATGTHFTLKYRESKTATDVTFHVEACNDMASWSSAGLFEIGRVNSNTYWEVTVRNAESIASATNRFMRVRISRP
jgi:hypothetical protein